jgi:hypothetical protein
MPTAIGSGGGSGLSILGLLIDSCRACVVAVLVVRSGGCCRAIFVCRRGR